MSAVVGIDFGASGLRVGAVVSALSLVAALAAYARARAALRARRASGS
jgi:sugar (pentulose or hexulose) kinase